jgi:hypothetical protein
VLAKKLNDFKHQAAMTNSRCPHCQKELPEKSGGQSCPTCGKIISAGSSQKFVVGFKHLMILLAPAAITMLVALLKSSSITTVWILISSPAAGLICGLMLTRNTKNIALRIFLALLLGTFLAVFCLISCFFGCALGGGGGVRIGG